MSNGSVPCFWEARPLVAVSDYHYEVNLGDCLSVIAAPLGYLSRRVLSASFEAKNI